MALQKLVHMFLLCCETSAASCTFNPLLSMFQTVVNTFNDTVTHSGFTKTKFNTLKRSKNML